MTKSTITREQLEEWVAQFDEDGGCDATDRQLEALIRQSLAALDSEPVTWGNGCDKTVPAALRYLAENERPFGGESRFNAAHLYQLAREIELMAEAPLYRHAQPAPVVEREPIAWLNDAYLARGVVDGEAGSEDAGPGYIPVYREAGPQPAPVVPENCVTAEHRRVIEMLLNVCGAAFELADDSCQQDVDGEDCHVVPDDAFQKLSDALDEIENTLPTEDIDRPDVFLAWSAMPRAALKSLLQAQPVPVVVAEAQSRAAFEQWCTVNIERNKWHPEFYAHLPAREQWEAWEACRAAMLAAAPQEVPDGK